MLLSLERLAGIDDMYSASSIVVRDIQASMTSKQVVFGLQVSAQAMSEKKTAQQLVQRYQTASRGRAL